jgi:glycosyltransferase involved in cell wall biosynthesis
MKVLFLAPQPFFEERGTPIAVRLALGVLAERGKEDFLLLTYHIGKDLNLPGITQLRIPNIPGIDEVPPGISVRKLICDFFLAITSLRAVVRHRKEIRLVHAVEESVFLAWLYKKLFGIPYVYDMDSSLALQLTDKWRLLRVAQPLLDWLEKLAVRSSVAVVPVCDSLAALADAHGSRLTHILRDISLISTSDEANIAGGLRAQCGLAIHRPLFLYIGNLERYQGIDLLVESFVELIQSKPEACLVIVGGSESDREKYSIKVRELQAENNIFIPGPRPVEELGALLAEADVLVSPRVSGDNTPMKIYSYLHAGKPLVATNLPTHTQVLDASVAFLAEPTNPAFSKALCQVLDEPEEARQRAGAAHQLAEENYTFEVFARRLNELYDRLLH